MKMPRKLITQLTELATKVEWPRYNGAFDGYRRSLRKVLYESGLIRDQSVENGPEIRYDDEDQNFHWEDYELADIDDSPFQDCRVQVHHTFTLDPRKGLFEEIKRLIAERDAWRQTVHAISRALIAASSDKCRCKGEGHRPGCSFADLRVKTAEIVDTGRTHFVGDDCPGGHRPIPKSTKE